MGVVTDFAISQRKWGFDQLQFETKMPPDAALGR